jgi:hypothetical protein
MIKCNQASTSTWHPLSLKGGSTCYDIVKPDHDVAVACWANCSARAYSHSKPSTGRLGSLKQVMRSCCHMSVQIVLDADDLADVPEDIVRYLFEVIA